MRDRFQTGAFQDPEALPEHQRRLHRRVMASVREERGQRLPPETDEERWPGLVQVEAEDDNDNEGKA